MKNYVLLVEDNKGFATVLKQHLEDSGFCVSLENNGVDGILRYLEGGVDIILLDVIMPRLSGVDTLRILKRCDPDIKAILFTGSSSEHVLKDVKELEPVCFLQKPFSTGDLVRIIRENLNGR